METTVVKALRVLEILAVEREVCTLGLVAERCGLTKSNTHRLLQTLIDCRYVRQDAVTKTYAPTMRLWELGTHIFRKIDLRSVAGPHLTALSAATDETVHLSLLDGADAVHLEMVESSQTIRVHIRVGERAPAFCTAIGRAILAFQSPSEALAACRELPRYTAETPSDLNAIRADLATIRKRGFAMTVGEFRKGVIGIAAPIRSGSGAVVAAIGIVAPQERLRQADIGRTAQAVMQAAAATSEGLGLDEPSVVHIDIVAETPEPAVLRRRKGNAAG